MEAFPIIKKCGFSNQYSIYLSPFPPLYRLLSTFGLPFATVISFSGFLPPPLNFSCCITPGQGKQLFSQDHSFFIFLHNILFIWLFLSFQSNVFPSVFLICPSPLLIFPILASVSNFFVIHSSPLKILPCSFQPHQSVIQIFFSSFSLMNYI